MRWIAIMACLGGCVQEAPDVDPPEVDPIEMTGSIDDGYAVPAIEGSATAVAVDGEDRIIVLISSVEGAAVLRLAADGSVDATFGVGGVAVIPDMGATAVVVVPGAIFVAGSCMNALCVHTLDDAGQPRSSARVESADSVEDAVADGDGSVWIAASQIDEEIGVVPAIARFSASGAADTSFGGDGVVAVGWSGVGTAIAVGPDGDVQLAAHGELDFRPAAVLQRVDRSGMLSPRVAIPERAPWDLVWRSDGALFVVGETYPFGDARTQLAVWAFEDPSFGASVIATAEIAGAEFLSAARAGVAVGDGFVVAGVGYAPGPQVNLPGAGLRATISEAGIVGDATLLVEDGLEVQWTGIAAQSDGRTVVVGIRCVVASTTCDALIARS